MRVLSKEDDGPIDGATRLRSPYGNGHLYLELGNTYRSLQAWRVSWEGVAKQELRWSRRPASHQFDQVLPWIDGKHLLRVGNDDIELIDGIRGTVVRTVRVP